MITAIITLGIGSLLAAGVLFKHERLLTLLAAAGAIWEAQWLLLTLIDRGWLGGQATAHVYLLGSLVLLVPWLFRWKEWSWPYQRPGSGRKDIVVLLVIILVVLAAWLVQSNNGLSGARWVSHGFYNGDTMTLMALVERSFLTEGLVAQNPFAGGDYLEYPTLWHGGLATLLKGLDLVEDWWHFLPALTYVQIVCLVPMFFLLMDLVWSEPANRGVRWLGVPARVGVLLAQAMIVFYVMGVSWDSYIYPQSHFFLTGIFLLLVSLLVKAEEGERGKLAWLVIPAVVVAVLLMLANAVTGAAAIAVTIIFFAWQILTKGGGKGTRLVFGGLIIVLLLIYMNWAVGDAVFGWPHFSYTSAESIMRLAPIVALLAAAVLLVREKRGYMAPAAVALMAMAMATFFFSNRDIIVANAERFIYHGLLVGFPLFLPIAIRGYYWAKNMVGLRASTRGEKVVTTVSLLAVALVVLMPVLISGARAHDQLMRQDEQIVDIDYRELLGYVKNNTGKDEIFLVQPDSPWALPMFTGRIMLRANYWLSPEDEVSAQVNRAFAGDTEAQQRALRKSDYLIINLEEKDNWEIDEQQQIFRRGKSGIYKTND